MLIIGIKTFYTYSLTRVYNWIHKRGLNLFTTQGRFAIKISVVTDNIIRLKIYHFVYSHEVGGVFEFYFCLKNPHTSKEMLMFWVMLRNIWVVSHLQFKDETRLLNKFCFVVSVLSNVISMNVSSTLWSAAVKPIVFVCFCVLQCLLKLICICAKDYAHCSFQKIVQGNVDCPYEFCYVM